MVTERLADISQRYVGTAVAQWARLSLGDIELNRGTSLLLNDKKEAREELRKSADSYQTLLSESRDPTILERATFGLARAHEALGTPADLDKARSEYRSIGTKWPDSVLAGAAAKRAEDLERPATKEFYDWIAKYEPPRPVAREPGRPGARPEFLTDPLEEGVQSPGTSGEKPTNGIFGPTSVTPLTKSSEPASETPEEATSETSSEKPAEPKAETPAEPSAEKPAQPEAEAPEKPAPESGETPSSESK